MNLHAAHPNVCGARKKHPRPESQIEKQPQGRGAAQRKNRKQPANDPQISQIQADSKKDLSLSFPL
jgi:hypothetical protein